MKLKIVTCLLATCACLFFQACKSDGDAARDAAVQGVQQGQQPAATTQGTQPATPATTPEPAQNAAGVWHYTCPKGCAGGAGSAIACPKCGTTLAHNKIYHGLGEPQTKLPAVKNESHAVSLPPGMVPVESPLKPTEASQNAKGVWHYTCPKGCAGGAGLALACQKCGTTLTHNQAYHQ